MDYGALHSDKKSVVKGYSANQPRNEKGDRRMSLTGEYHYRIAAQLETLCRASLDFAGKDAAQIREYIDVGEYEV